MPKHTINMGVVGMGRAFTIMLPTFIKDPRVALVAGADPRAEARAQFEKDFNATSYEALEPLLDGADIDAVYLATPVGGHVEQIKALAAAGKHILIEKPLALTLSECQSIIDTVRGAGVQLIVGH
ncbi:MAG: Gfo/Idh/MocA family oxidoreductase, partial [Proteobacteria bacterium]|nr:Gfo/Idh/MocA family oxidoreductase [Pseudomonadota bacterium]